jgi:hypothetical protein
LPSEKSALLNQAEGESFFIAFYRAEVPKTIASGVITLEGSGFYTLTPESGVTDDLTGITLLSENVNGATIHLAPATIGHTIIVRHQAGIHLQGGADATLATIYSGIWLRHKGSGVFFELMPRMNVP